MGALATMNPTLMDVARRLDPNGAIATIVELLAMTNDWMMDAVWIECNKGTSHVSTIRTGIPNGTWRKLYGFVQPSKSTTEQVEDTCGMLEDRSQIDVDLYELNGRSKEWRLSEDVAHLEGMNQDVSETLFYGDTDVYPERFMGLSSRFNEHQSTNKKLSSFNVINAGGEGEDNTSIWFIVWGKQTAHMLYPKGSKAGLEHKDLGEQEISNAEGGRMTVVESKFKWKPGFCVRDWRAVCRIANIDVSDLLAEAEAQADLYKMLTKAYHRIRKSKKLGKAAIYCNSTVLEALDLQAQKKTNLHLTYRDIDGEEILTYRRIPIRECESILDSEAVVPAAA